MDICCMRWLDPEKGWKEIGDMILTIMIRELNLKEENSCFIAVYLDLILTDTKQFALYFIGRQAPRSFVSLITWLKIREFAALTACVNRT